MAKEQDRREQLNALLGKMEKDLIKIYGATYTDVLKIQQVRQAIESGADFTWKGNPAAAKQLEKRLNTLAKKTEELTQSGIEAAYNAGPSYNTINAIGGLTGKTQSGKALTNEIIEDATKDMRKRGATSEAFYNKPQGGLTISDRIWRNVSESKSELQAIIQSEIAQGHSADQATKMVRKYLLHPEEIPQFVKDANGELVLNKAWVEYRPGVGIYKSAYKNALRLTRTEINMAYNRAEVEQFKSDPLITGYRVVISGNHMGSKHGQEICELLAGTYPKNFIFTGWHPQCRCHMEAITISKEDFKEYIKAKHDGKEAEFTPKNEVTDPPKNFTDWVKNNKDRIDAARTKPFFIRDNYKGGDPEKGFISDIANKMKTPSTPATPSTPSAPKAPTTPTPTAPKPSATPSTPNVQQTKEEEEKAVALQKDLEQYTPEQKAFFDDFTNQTGIERGLSMSIEEADKSHANPKYIDPYMEDEKGRYLISGKRASKNPQYSDANEPYHVNCQTCVPAYQLRKWGFDVEATPNYKNKGSLNEYIAGHVEETWLDKDGNNPKIFSYEQWLDKKNYSFKMTPAKYKQYFEEACKEEGTYQVTLVWKRCHAAHTAIIESKGGVLTYIDPQINNSKGALREGTTLESVINRLTPTMHRGWNEGVIKIDGLTINPKYYSLFTKATNNRKGNVVK